MFPPHLFMVWWLIALQYWIISHYLDVPHCIHSPTKEKLCIFKSRDITLLTKAHTVKATIFPVHVWMWEVDHKEGWVPKNWCFWTVVLEKTLESPLDYKAIKPVHPKGNQSWVFIGRTDTEVEALILWPPDEKSPLIGKELGAESAMPLDPLVQ